uniref:Uncharacterized protein n=1 Tax=Anopheles atroparvus TaxID=41427 RepID=A0A182JMB6_ANOAO
MKFSIVLLLAVVAVSVAVAKTVPKNKSSLPLDVIARMFSPDARLPKVPKDYVRNPRTVEGRFTSRVNHFDPQDRNTFEFNYLTNDQYYREGGPLYGDLFITFPPRSTLTPTPVDLLRTISDPIDNDDDDDAHDEDYD